jgi:RNA polymerase sigma-70 factor (ECF subfamily)
MYRITINRCLTMRRRRRPPTLPLDTVAEPATGDARSQPARSAEQDAATEALSRALAELDAGQRICWILRELQGLPYNEIAHVTRTSEQTVRGRLFRARRSLQEAMGPWR